MSLSNFLRPFRKDTLEQLNKHAALSAAYGDAKQHAGWPLGACAVARQAQEIRRAECFAGQGFKGEGQGE